jgi:hypothetical protein
MSRPKGSKNKTKISGVETQVEIIKRGRGRPRKLIMPVEENIEQVKRGRKEKILENELKLTCCKCGREYLVTVNHKELYTDDIKAKWTCYCKKDK